MDRPRIIDTSRTGFTVVELVIVVLILGILAATGAPRFAASLNRHRVEAAARRVAGDLRMVRDRARTGSSDKTASFDVPGNSYLLFPNIDSLDHPGQTYTVELSESPYHAAILSADFGGDAEVVFNGYGAADSSGQVVVASGSDQRTITLDSQTGQITVKQTGPITANEASQTIPP